MVRAAGGSTVLGMCWLVWRRMKRRLDDKWQVRSRRVRCQRFRLWSVRLRIALQSSLRCLEALDGTHRARIPTCWRWRIRLGTYRPCSLLHLPSNDT